MPRPFANDLVASHSGFGRCEHHRAPRLGKQAAADDKAMGAALTVRGWSRRGQVAWGQAEPMEHGSERRRCGSLGCRWLALALVCLTRALWAEQLPDVAATQYQAAEKVGTQQARELTECSGLAISRVRPDALWTHNDSGDRPRLYLQSLSGELLMRCDVEMAKAQDWEDVASFVLDGKPYLLIADVGDNRRKRRDYQLYLVPEPTAVTDKVQTLRTITFQYEDGPQDCESLAFDPTSQTILLVSKTWTPGCRVYALPWPAADDHQPQVARVMAHLTLAGLTAMDISPDGRRAIVGSYTDAYEFVRGAEESWADAFLRPPFVHTMPPRAQGEAICYGSDGRTLFLNSEKRQSPIFRIRPVGP